jgi:glyoxylase-like metal-dependent hydrolase (beta-lactamase superfamily II)
MRTLIPPGQAQVVTDWDEQALSFRATGQHCPRFGFDGLLRPGQDITLGELAWQVHAAPGHDPHSVVLFEPASRTLISADALWENGFGVVFPELEGEQGFDEVSATLDLIEALAPLTVVPGHGPVFSFSKAVMGRARQRLDSFVLDPVRHAQHAGKVLLKFKLLEVQQQQRPDFMAWALSMPYMVKVHQRFFANTDLESWLKRLLADLVKSGAAETCQDWVRNR